MKCERHSWDTNDKEWCWRCEELTIEENKLKLENLDHIISYYNNHDTNNRQSNDLNNLNKLNIDDTNSLEYNNKVHLDWQCLYSSPIDWYSGPVTTTNFSFSLPKYHSFHFVLCRKNILVGRFGQPKT